MPFNIYKVEHELKSTGAKKHYEHLVADDEQSARSQLHKPPYVIVTDIESVPSSNFVSLPEDD